MITPRLVALSALSMLACTQAKAPQNTPAATADDEQGLLAFEQQEEDAVLRHDVPTIARMLDDRFVSTDARGQTVDKAGFLAKMRDFALKAAVLKDWVAHVYGDTGVVVGTENLTVVTSSGEDKDWSIRYTCTYLRRDGQWRFISEQYGIIVPGK